MLVFWLVLGVVLLVVELTHFGFFAIFAAAGALAAALVALALPDAVALQVLTAVVVCAIGIWAFRPMMRKALHQRNDSHPARGVHGTLVGEEVLTLDVVGDGGDFGHVRLAGERWLAVSGGAAHPGGPSRPGHRRAGHDARRLAGRGCRRLRRRHRGARAAATARRGRRRRHRDRRDERHQLGGLVIAGLIVIVLLLALRGR